MQVTLRGPSFLLNRAFSSPPRFEVVLPDNVDARYSAQLPIDDLKLPSSIQVDKVQPAEIEFVFDNVVETNLRVQVPLVGNVPTGFHVESVEVDPPSIPVSGAASELRGLKLIQTAPLVLQDLTEDVQEELKLRLPGRYSRSRRNSVVARVKIVQKHGNAGN